MEPTSLHPHSGGNNNISEDEEDKKHLPSLFIQMEMSQILEMQETSFTSSFHSNKIRCPAGNNVYDSRQPVGLLYL